MPGIIPFEDYEISRETGFSTELPDSLPDYYKPWHELASKTTNLMASQTMRVETLKLPLLNTSQLKTYRELKLAHLQLCVISGGYCWERGPMGLPPFVPASVAIPLCEISDKLGMQPGMSYSCMLGNWQRIDKSRPPTRDNIKVRYVFPGGQQYVDFMILTAYIEILFSETFPALEDILEGSKLNNVPKVVAGLTFLIKWVKEIHVLSKDFHIITQPDVFFRQIIAILRGFNETCNLPDGMTYEGVTDRPKRIVRNSAASQSAIFQIIDTILGIDYSPDKKKFFKELRETWPSKYQEFFQFLQAWPGDVRKMASSGANEVLTKAYNELVDAVQQFRTYHLQLVTKFMLIPNKRVREENGITGPDQLSAILPVLKEIRNTTAATKQE